MKRILIALTLAAGLFTLNALIDPETAASQIGYQISASTVTATTGFLAADGSVSAPSYSFSTDSTTGIYYTTNEFNIAIAGSNRAEVTAAGIRATSGTSTIPGISFLTDTNSGWYSDGSDGIGLVLGAKDGGLWKVATGTIANAALKTLNATPVEVIAAPAAGTAIVIESARFMLDFATAAFDGSGAGEDLVLAYVTGGTELLHCDQNTCINAAATSDVYGWSSHSPNSAARGIAILDNDAVDLSILSGEWFAAAGGGALHYTIRYREVVVDIS